MPNTGDFEMDYVIKTLENKGYGSINIKVDWINKHPFIVLYCIDGVTELTQKFNYLGVGVLPIKECYTMGIPAINLNHNTDKVFEKVDEITPKGEAPKMDDVKSIEDVSSWIQNHYQDDVSELIEWGIDNPIAVISVLNQKYQLGLVELTESGIVTEYVDVCGVIV